jgi:hypothetical protein
VTPRQLNKMNDVKVRETIEDENLSNRIKNCITANESTSFDENMNLSHLCFHLDDFISVGYFK